MSELQVERTMLGFPLEQTVRVSDGEFTVYLPGATYDEMAADGPEVVRGLFDGMKARTPR